MGAGCDDIVEGVVSDAQVNKELESWIIELNVFVQVEMVGPSMGRKEKEARREVGGLREVWSMAIGTSHWLLKHGDWQGS